MDNQQGLHHKAVTWTSIKFDIWDRFRILFGAIPCVEVTIHLPVAVEHYSGSSSLIIKKRTMVKFEQDKPKMGYFNEFKTEPHEKPVEEHD